MSFKKILICLILMLLSIFSIISLDLEFDTNNDKKTDKWMTINLYKDWKRFDFNKNDKADEEWFYIDATNKIYFIDSEKIDYNTGKGTPNVWIKYYIKDNDVITELTADKENNGIIELYLMKKNGYVIQQKTDNNNDKKFDVEEYYDESGYKIKEFVDINKDGKFDDYYYYEKNKLKIEELDTNFDGKADQWVYFEYNEDGSIKECIIKKDNNHDGNPDEWHYTDDKRRVKKIEYDKDFDGKVDDVKQF